MKFISFLALILGFILNAQAAAPVPFQGVWQTTCHQQGRYYYMLEINIHEDIWDVTEWYAKDQYCENVALEKHDLYEVSLDNEYWNAKAIMSYLRPYTRELANQYNEKQLCGHQNWKQGRRIEVGGKDCEGFVIPKIEQKLYSIYKTEGPKNNILYIGTATEGFDGLSEDKRHREFSPFILIRDPSSL